MSFEQARDLAGAVAIEIDTAVGRYMGPNWETVDGQGRAVPFQVFAPTLQGKSPDELRDEDRSFDVMVGQVGRYVWLSGRSHRILWMHNYLFEFEAENGFYTGNATVWLRDS